NFREKLWNRIGGQSRAVDTIGRIVKQVDVLVGNEEDLQKGLGITGPEVSSKSKLDPASFFAMIDRVIEKHPHVKIVATTLREVYSATRHCWGAVAWIGGGQHVSMTFDLSPAELREILEHTLLRIAPGARILAIIPDKTRDDNTDLLFPFAADILSSRQVAQFDALVAQGTHGPMTIEEKRSKLGFANGTLAPVLGQIFDHEWNVPEELTTIGELSAAEVTRLTNGLISDAVK